MKIRRKEFIAEIKRLKRELADASARLSELEELANPDCAIAKIVPENTPVDEDENSIAAKVAFGMLKLRMRP
jgi:seryl-tRNA synthetase